MDVENDIEIVDLDTDIDTDLEGIDEGQVDENVIKQPNSTPVKDADAKEAPALKGSVSDKGDKVEMPKTKVGMISAMNTHMMGMKKDSLTAAYKKMMEDVEGIELEETSVNFDDDLEAMVSEEATLSEGFKAKAALIMESAVNARVSREVAEIESRLNEAHESEIAELSESMTDKVGEYLDYVVEQFMADNELAINNGLRTEIAEDFMGKLHGLFTESYIEVPDTKVDLVDSLSEENDTLRAKLNESIEIGLEADKMLKSYQRNQIVAEAASQLTATQAEKLEALAEGIEFNNESDFAHKVDTLVESYFSEKVKTVTSELVEETQIEDEEEASAPTHQDPYVAMTLAGLRAK